MVEETVVGTAGGGGLERLRWLDRRRREGGGGDEVERRELEGRDSKGREREPERRSGGSDVGCWR